MKDRCSDTASIRERNELLLQKLNHLKKIYIAKDNEVEELEEVLIKAEKTIEEKEELLKKKRVVFKSESTLNSESDNSELEAKLDELKLQNEALTDSLSLSKKTVSDLEKELKLYTVKGEDDEFIISKDQFIHIEEQLISYQKEIKALKEAHKNVREKKEEHSLKSEASEMDDSSIVRLFRDTYKKITKN